MEDSQLIHIREKETAIDIWNALKDLHERDTVTNKVFLYKKIAAHKLKSNMEDYISEMMNLFQRLSDLGAEGDDEWKIGMLLGNLPEDYNTLVTALEARESKVLTLNLYIRNYLTNTSERTKKKDR